MLTRQERISTSNVAGVRAWCKIPAALKRRSQKQVDNPSGSWGGACSTGGGGGGGGGGGAGLATATVVKVVAGGGGGGGGHV